MDGHPRIVLDNNELPWPTTAGQFVNLQQLVQLELNRYPEDRSPALRARLASYCGCQPEAITVGNGAADILDMALAALGAPGDRLLLVEPSFPLFHSLARVHHKQVVSLPCRPDLSIDAEQLLQTMQDTQPRLVLLASPGNPTGLCPPAKLIERLLAYENCTTILDEVYFEHAKTHFSWATRIDDFANLVVIRSLSKLGLAGLRIGYAIAGSKLTAQLHSAGRRYRIGSLTEQVTLSLLKQPQLIEANVTRSVDERERIKAALRRMDTLQVIDSEANFNVVCRKDGRPSADLLRQEGIDVFAFAHAQRHFLRISLGSAAAGDAMLEALSKMLQRG